MRDLFTGRVGRVYFFVGVVIITVVADFIGMTFRTGNLVQQLAYLLVAVILLALYTSLYTRRLHDVGKSGYWALWAFVPIANLILFAYLIFKAGDRKKNHFGAIPSSFAF